MFLILAKLFIFGLLGADQRSVATTGALSTTIPNITAFNAAETVRVELRVHDLPTAQSATRRNILLFQGNLLIRIVENTRVLQVDNPGSIASSALTSTYYNPDNIPTTSDIIIRYQFRRLSATLVRPSLTIWDSATMQILDHRELTAPETTASSTINISGAAYLGDGSGGSQPCDCKVAWVRVYSTPATPVDLPTGNTAGGDLLDWEFADSLVDSVRSQTFSGTAAYSNTPVYLTLPPHISGRAGWPITMDFRQADGTAYAAQVIAKTGNKTPLIQKTATTGVFSLLAAEPGNYTIRAFAKIGASQYTQDISVGSVKSNASEVVDPGDTTRNFILGPVSNYKNTPWKRYAYFRNESLRVYGNIYQSIVTQDFSTPLAGTITVTNGSTTITGSSTAFQTDFACNGTDYILIRYPVGGGVFGAEYKTVSSCASNTSMTISTTWPGATNSGVSYQKWTETTALRWTEGINYYDSVLAQYQNWYATRNSAYLTYARTLADGWWNSPKIDGGRKAETISTSHSFPRQIAFGGLALYALDKADQGDTTTATNIKKWLNHHLDLTFYLYVTNSNPTNKPSWFGITPREAGYATYHAAILGEIGENITGTVNTSGTSVTLVSGDNFNLYNMAGKTITINGTGYVISSVASTSSLTLQSSAGTQNGVAYSYDIKAHWKALTNDSITSFWQPWQCTSGNASPRCSDSWSLGAYRGTDALWTGHGNLPWHDQLAIGDLLGRLFALSWFTESTTLDTIIAAHGNHIKNGVAKYNGGASTPKIFIETTGYLSLPCRSPQYWAYTSGGAQSDADGNQTSGTGCATKDLIESNRTLNNEVISMYRVFSRTQDTTYRDLADKMFAAAFGGDDGPEVDGIGGYGMQLPIASNRWSLTNLSNPASLKQLGQGARGSLGALTLRLNSPYDSGGTGTVYIGFRLPSGTDRVVYETADGQTGTCMTSPCSLSITYGLGNVYRFVYKSGSTTIKTGNWKMLR